MSPYLVWISLGFIQPVRPMHHVDILLAVLEEALISRFVDLLDLVAAKDVRLDGPVGMLYIVDLGRDRGDDAKVVAGALDGPPEIRVRVDSLEGAVGEDNVGGEELVRDETVTTLQPAVASPEGGTNIANALAGTRDYERE